MFENFLMGFKLCNITRRRKNNKRKKSSYQKTFFHLKNNLRKNWKIEKYFTKDEIRFLAKLITQFKTKNKKNRLIIRFVFNYFEKASNEIWPKKQEILKILFNHLSKKSTRQKAKHEFDKWWPKN